MTFLQDARSENEFSSWAALYVLGTLSDAEKQEFELHLSHCEACRGAVEKYAAIVGQIAMSAPSQPDETSRARLMLRLKSQLPEREFALLNDVLITRELSKRRSHKKNTSHLESVLHRLAPAISGGRQHLLDELVNAALELCDAGSAGFSVLRDEEHVFRWDALAGELSDQIGGTTPRNWSPCGTTLDIGSAQLFDHPSRCFEYFKECATPLVEGLVVPVYRGREPFGTLWVASHEEGRRFNREDLRAMNCLADFCSAAVTAMQQGRQADSQQRER